MSQRTVNPIKPSHHLSDATGEREKNHSLSVVIIPVTQHAGKNLIKRIKPRVNIPNRLLSGFGMRNEQNEKWDAL